MWIFFNFYVIQLLFAMCFMKTLMKVTNKHLGLIINKHCWSFDLFRFFSPFSMHHRSWQGCARNPYSVFFLFVSVSLTYVPHGFYLPVLLVYRWHQIFKKRGNVTSDWWLETSASLDSLPMLYLCTRQSQAPSRDRKRKQTFPVTINKLAPVLVTLKCVLLRYFCH